MNTQIMLSHILQAIVDTPVWCLLLLKITAILGLAWLAHLALFGANPRWRVLLWRMTAAGLLLLPGITWFLPAVQIRFIPSPENKITANQGDSSQNIALTNPTLAESLKNEPTGESGKRLLRTDSKQFAYNAGGMDAIDPSRSGAPRFTPPQSTPIHERTYPLSLQNMLLAVWLGGVFIFALRACIGQYRIWQIVGRAEQSPEGLRAECGRVAGSIGCATPVEIMQSEQIRSPLLCGLWRPLLLLPARMCEDTYHCDLPGIFAHELTHVRCHDLLWNAGLHVISILLWFHPLAWRLRKAHLGACELVCDAVSAGFVGDVNEYCRTLARVAVDLYSPQPAAGIAMARLSTISRRLEALKKGILSMPLHRRNVIGFGMAALLAVAVLGLLQFAFAAPPAVEPVTAATNTDAGASKETTTTKSTYRVVDSKGVGIAKAKVVPQVQEGIPTWSATTDDQGRYSIPPLGPGVKSEMITITAPGYLKREILRIGNRPVPDIPLQKAASIEGRILGPDGKPLANAPLAIGIYSDFVGTSANYLHAISNDEGKYKIENIPPGVVVLYYPGATPSQYELESGRETKLLSPGEKWPEPPVKDAYGSILVEAKDGEQITDLVMDLSQSTCSVQGRVDGPYGAPLPGAIVSAKRFCNNLFFKNLICQLDAGDLSVKSDLEGRYKLEHLPPGEWALSAWHPHFQRLGKNEYITFSSGEQKKAQDLQVFERYESENVFPDRMALEKSATLTDLQKQKGFTFEIPTKEPARKSSHAFRFGELNVNSVPGVYIKEEQLGLPADVAPEQIARTAHVGELYYVAPDSLVTVNGTILAPCKLPEKTNPEEKPLSQLSRLTRAEIQEQVEASRRETPEGDGRQIKVKKGEWYIAVRNDGRAFLINIGESLSKDYIRLLTYYIGQLDIGAPQAQNSVAAKPDGDAAPAKIVHGKVVDENEKPIAGADVWMMPVWDPVRKRPATHATSDTQGRFTVPVPPLADYDRQQLWPYAFGTLWVYAEGHQLSTGYSGDQIFGRDKSDVMFRLKPATETAFVVLAPDGKPLEGAIVEPNYVSTGEPPDEVLSRIAVRTNAEGRAVITALTREALVTIRIVTVDFGIQMQHLHGIGSISSDQAIRLRQGGRIEGRVTAEKPEMARGVRITLVTGTPRSYQPGGGPSMTNGSADVVSDAEGEFLVPVMAAGGLGIDAHVDAGLPVLPRIPDYTKHAIEVHPGETTSLRIPLETAVAVRGSVRAKDTGKPIPDGIVQIHYGADMIQETLAKNDAQGNFTASVLPGQIRVEVLCRPDKYIQFGAWPEYEIPASVKKFEVGPVELVPTKNISGRLVDKHDQPVANRTLWVAANGRSYGYATTDAKGDFSLTGVPSPIDPGQAKYETVPTGETTVEPIQAKIAQTSPLVLRVEQSAPAWTPPPNLQPGAN
jgi:beta-lactamase regulating signal transducer with metallopeptidase domain